MAMGLKETAKDGFVEVIPSFPTENLQVSQNGFPRLVAGTEKETKGNRFSMLGSLPEWTAQRHTHTHTNFSYATFH